MYYYLFIILFLILDAESKFYQVGDIIDMRDREQGAWFEGKIVRIVHEPDKQHIPETNYVISDHNQNDNNKVNSDKESDSENKPPSATSSQESPSKTKKKGIAKYFSKSVNNKKKQATQQLAENIDNSILFKIQLDAE